jgi:hypothetical protein
VLTQQLQDQLVQLEQQVLLDQQDQQAIQEVLVQQEQLVRLVGQALYQHNLLLFLDQQAQQDLQVLQQ